jgi:hypothetical protein
MIRIRDPDLVPKKIPVPAKKKPPHPPPASTDASAQPPAGNPAAVHEGQVPQHAMRRPGERNSPTSALEAMDWSSTLDGVKRLVQEPPPSTRKEEGVPAPVPPPTANPRGAAGCGDTAKKPDGEAEDPYLRAAAYLKRIKAAQVENIKSKMAKDMLAYNTIRSHNLRESTTDIMVGDESHVTNLEGMVDMGDPRMLAANLNLDLKTKRIITTSYTSNWRCIMCGPHGSRQAFNMRGAAEGTGGRQAVVLADQGFPAILPAAGTDSVWSS